MTELNVLAVASEIFPVVKTGGLADVTGALPPALKRLGIHVRTLVPGYPQVLAALAGAVEAVEVPDLVGGPARILFGAAAGLPLAVLDAPQLFHRPGGPYGDHGGDYPDNPIRFAALAHAAGRIAAGGLGGGVPDLVHAHDWQAGLVPAVMAASAIRPATVMTVHNLAFQGQYDGAIFPSLGLPPAFFDLHGVEYYGGVGFLKAGLFFADRISTVSPTYACEIMTHAGGMGLEGLLRSRSGDVRGILNGIDTEIWDPAEDARLPARFTARKLQKRARNKAALAAQLGLDDAPEALLFGIVSRLTWQKGLDFALEVVPEIVAAGGMLAVVGAGDAALEAAWSEMARRYPGRVGTWVGYSEDLAHMVQGGSDALLVPSRFEPCGLTQLCALRYGALPVAARVGGLADTIVDANAMALAAGAGTGFLFSPADGEHLGIALRRVFARWADRKGWEAMQKRAMATDVGWSVAAAGYADLYREAIATRRP